MSLVIYDLTQLIKAKSIINVGQEGTRTYLGAMTEHRLLVQLHMLEQQSSLMHESSHLTRRGFNDIRTQPLGNTGLVEDDLRRSVVRRWRSDRRRWFWIRSDRHDEDNDSKAKGSLVFMVLDASSKWVSNRPSDWTITKNNECTMDTTPHD